MSFDTVRTQLKESYDDEYATLIDMCIDILEQVSEEVGEVEDTHQLKIGKDEDGERLAALKFMNHVPPVIMYVRETGQVEIGIL